MLKPALSTFYSKNEGRKHLGQKDFNNVLKVSRFFAFFYDVFVVHLCLEEIKSCSGVLLFVRLLNLFILWRYNKALLKCLFPPPGGGGGTPETFG